jgi:hypothetical protein
MKIKSIRGATDYEINKLLSELDVIDIKVIVHHHKSYGYLDSIKEYIIIYRSDELNKPKIFQDYHEDEI